MNLWFIPFASMAFTSSSSVKGEEKRSSFARKSSKRERRGWLVVVEAGVDAFISVVKNANSALTFLSNPVAFKPESATGSLETPSNMNSNSARECSGNEYRKALKRSSRAFSTMLRITVAVAVCCSCVNHVNKLRHGAGTFILTSSMTCFNKIFI